MWEYNNTDELYHYGIMGMKWGKGRKQMPNATIRQAKAAYKAANKQYSKDYKTANRYSTTHLVSQYIGKKQKATSNANWERAINSAKAANKAKKAYKEAKKNQAAKKEANRAIIRQAKAAYKAANKQYSKDYKTANRYSTTHLVSQYIGKKQKATSNANWERAINSAKAANKAKKAYKEAKKKYR